LLPGAPQGGTPHAVSVVLKVNGGANSGHTAGGIKLNLLPAGVVARDAKHLCIGSGVVADPRKIWWETKPLEAKGHAILSRLLIDERTMVTDLTHRLLDLAWEDYRANVLAEEPRGSTGRGITRLADIPDGQRRDGGPELVTRGEHPWLALRRQDHPWPLPPLAVGAKAEVWLDRHASLRLADAGVSAVAARDRPAVPRSPASDGIPCHGADGPREERFQGGLEPTRKTRPRAWIGSSSAPRSERRIQPGQSRLLLLMVLAAWPTLAEV
jgi:hypothetical protein